MDPPSELARWLDFDRGLEFQDEVRRRFKCPVHHPFPSPNGSFFLLVTFRRFLFRLTEESVGLALQSCLGGRAEEFHVQFLSNNHFRISVFSKEIGFFIYKLRRVTTSSFDLYFHLWNNGTPHWEKEKRAWEIEQEKEWTKVLSKPAKRGEKRKQNLKRVRFADPIVQGSILKKNNSVISICFGSFSSTIDPSNPLERSIFSSPERTTVKPVNMAKSAPGSSSRVLNSNPNSSPKPSGHSLVCFRCLDLGHTRRYCRSGIRCARCLELGHIQRFCKAKQPTRKLLQWRPKAFTSSARPSIVWRPKNPIPELRKRKEILAHNSNLDSCAPPDLSASLTTEQEQIVCQSATNLQPGPGSGHVDANQIPHHIAVPQHILDVEMSDSSMRFLRANGLDIAINEVMRSDDGSDDGSSSNDATSDTAAEERARSYAAISLLHRKGLPSNSPGFLTVMTKPIFIDSALLANQNCVSTQTHISGMEIAPWRPAPAVILLRAFPYLMDCCRRATALAAARAIPPMLIDASGVVQGEVYADGSFQLSDTGETVQGNTHCSDIDDDMQEKTNGDEYAGNS